MSETNLSSSKIALSFEKIDIELAYLRRKVDPPWWQNPSNGIALLAFILSLITSVASLVANRQKDLHDRQSQLATVVEKLTVLPMTFADFVTRHKGESLGNLDDQFNIQNAMLAHEGYQLVKILKTNAAPAEFLAVASALSNTGAWTQTIEVLQNAVAGSDNWYDELGAMRYLGTALIKSAATERQLSQGDDVFGKALTIGSRYDSLGSDLPLLAYQNALTEEKWGEALAFFNCGKAGEHLRAARVDAAEDQGLPDTPKLLAYNATVDQLVNSCAPGDRLHSLPPIPGDLPIDASDGAPAGHPLPTPSK